MGKDADTLQKKYDVVGIKGDGEIIISSILLSG